jgi:hypothetical protein
MAADRPSRPSRKNSARVIMTVSPRFHRWLESASIKSGCDSSEFVGAALREFAEAHGYAPVPPRLEYVRRGRPKQSQAQAS